MVLHRALMKAKKLSDQGERNATKLLATAREELASEPLMRLDYLEIVDPDSLDAVEDISKGAVMVVAAFVGTTRLIDNILLP
jgi:pantothenate synthetase